MPTDKRRWQPCSVGTRRQANRVAIAGCHASGGWARDRNYHTQASRLKLANGGNGVGGCRAISENLGQMLYHSNWLLTRAHDPSQRAQGPSRRWRHVQLRQATGSCRSALPSVEHRAVARRRKRTLSCLIVDHVPVKLAKLELIDEVRQNYVAAPTSDAI